MISSPIGFNLANAMSLDDVGVAVEQAVLRTDYNAPVRAAAVLGQMICEDRHAQLSFERQDREFYAFRLGTIVANVKADIEHAVVWGTDKHTDAIY